MTKSGAFIVFEGGEGAGKSTQERLLAEHLAAAGLPVLRTREPGGTPAAERIRAILLDPASAGLDIRAEALLFAAARGDHVARVVRPALQVGTTVICDRYLDSSVAYQGYGRQMDPEQVRQLSLWATFDLLPDLTIILDVEPRVGLARVSDPDRLEAEPLEYHERVRHGFLTIAAADPARYLVIDGSKAPDEIAVQVFAGVDALLASR
ncbi:MAG: dTMP kinase [Actinomycetales bacterium]|nr:dTMP kinase [Actinomycetales bacterium]